MNDGGAEGSQRIVVGPIAATSPSLSSRMRLCMLRAGLSQVDGASAFILGSPKAWVGTAYHEVLSWAKGIEFGDESLEREAQKIWEAAVSRLYEEAQDHPLNKSRMTFSISC